MTSTSLLILCVVVASACCVLAALRHVLCVRLDHDIHRYTESGPRRVA